MSLAERTTFYGSGRSSLRSALAGSAARAGKTEASIVRHGRWWKSVQGCPLACPRVDARASTYFVKRRSVADNACFLHASTIARCVNL
jgi:hypothetical protein